MSINNTYNCQKVTHDQGIQLSISSTNIQPDEELSKLVNEVVPRQIRIKQEMEQSHRQKAVGQHPAVKHRVLNLNIADV